MVPVKASATIEYKPFLPPKYNMTNKNKPINAYNIVDLLWL